MSSADGATGSRRSGAPRSGAPRNVLLIGGTSEIGLAIARRLAQDGPIHPVLLGRDPQRLQHALASLDQPGIVELLDADALEGHGEVIARVFEQSGGFDIVVLAIGLLGAQEGLDADPSLAADVMRVNFLGCGLLLLHCMRRLREQGRPGTMIVLSTVAAERARASNAVYGAAKAGLDALAQGLADASASSGPRVLVVRPGFVRTKMTAGLRPAPFAVTADAVAEATVRGLRGRAHTIWVPASLRFVFVVLRHLPRVIFRKLPL